uniref:INCENP_ARK-bind domain-containing protein n=1 Tax=Anopheles epiroticus TaxID=199890 RepID=A0A182PS93_9DIPT
MDELLEVFNTFIGEAFDRERAMDAEFVEFEKRLNECVTLAKERGTPVQNKKRPKRQASLSEMEEDSDTSKRGEEDKREGVTNDRSSSGVPRSSARMLDISDKVETEKTAPQPMDTTNAGETESFVRPSRTARIKAQEKLKEPMLGGKLRNDGGVAVTVKIERISTAANNSTTMRGGKVADVSTAKEKTTHERTYVDMETENDANQANRIIPSPGVDKRNDEGFSSATDEASKKEPPKQPAKDEREQSLLVIPAVVPKVEIVSDEEMPPPSMPPPKLPAPKVRTKKKPTVANNQKEANDTTASSSAVSSADSTMNSTSSSVNSSASTGRTGRPGRPRKVQPDKQPAEEEAPTAPPSVSMELNVVIEPVRIKTEKLSIGQLQQAPPRDSRASDKSNYEDAQEQQNQPQAEMETTSELVKQMRPLQVALQKIPLNELAESRTVPDLNGTYTMAQPAAPSDGTFVMLPSVQNSTFTVNSPLENAPGSRVQCNETFTIPATEGSNPSGGQTERRPDDTFTIEKKESSEGRHHPHANASIMTEDDSVIENSPVQTPAHMPETFKSKTTPRAKVAAPVPGPKPQKYVSVAGTLKKSASASTVPGASKSAEAKKQKELFNPCVMSPIKSRIEAFEKCATTGTSTSKIGTPQAQIGRLMKTVSTPTIGTEQPHGLVRSAHAKPLASSAYTPNCASQPPMPKASSASKISQMQTRALHHGTSTTSSGQVTRSQSRDSSWDRAGGGGGSGTLSAASSTSSLLDEKKKKREEKQRLATAQREAMEREKREHAERLLREKEEKYRKLVHEKQEKMRLEAQKKARKLEEFEKRRQAEEQKTLADQKRDELAKQLADQQRIDRELLEALKPSQTKDTHEAKLHKQLYQQKLRQQQQLEKQQHQQQLAAKKKQAAATKKQVFTFEMIDTDDSTDEEVAEDTSAPRKKQRPPVPEWCQNTPEYRKQLKIQAQIDTKVIDRLFSVQPMTPDLRELFPSIDAHKLKRNSSAIWRTPPRHSQLP